MSESEQAIDRQNSVKLAVNAKGQWSGELKVYAETIDEAMKTAVKKAEELSKTISLKNTGSD
jgi:hypothetical protein